MNKPTNFPVGTLVRNIYTGKIDTVAKGYWQQYDGGSTSDYTIEFEGGGWNKSTNLERVPTIWESDGTDGPCLICAPPKGVK